MRSRRRISKLGGLPARQAAHGQRTSAALADAESYFRQGDRARPEVRARLGGLADTLTTSDLLQPADRWMPVSTRPRRQRARALELDPNLAEAWASAGPSQTTGGSSSAPNDVAPGDRAQSELRAGAPVVERDPLRELGRRDEALASVERAVALDPLSAIINNSLGDARANVGRFDDALARTSRRSRSIRSARSVLGSRLRVCVRAGSLRQPRCRWYEKAATLIRAIPSLPASGLRPAALGTR